MSSHRGQFVAEVVENRPLCREHSKLILGLPRFPRTKPGQFVQVAAREVDLIDAQQDREVEWDPARPAQFAGHELLSPTSVLRRPFSLAGRRDVGGRVELDLIHRVVGVGTSWMSARNPGDAVHLLGPLGNAFTLPPDDGTAIMVGGGVGIPPMIYLAGDLAGRKAIAFAGATTLDLLALTFTDDVLRLGPEDFEGKQNVTEFARHGIPAVITTDDGSYGFRGFVTQALERYLDAHITDNAERARAVIYTCGPEAMMKRVAEIAVRRGIACQVAVERAMACGMGTCQSCCIKVKKPDPAKPPLPGSDWCYRLACTDGPVFAGKDLLW
jgi:dihydroorotate dehydrogenase electron transfer subunit